jgi:hypothetical protein
VQRDGRNDKADDSGEHEDQRDPAIRPDSEPAKARALSVDMKRTPVRRSYGL